MKTESTLAFLQSLLELRLEENIDDPHEHAFNDKLAFQPISALQTQLISGGRELALPGLEEKN